MEYPLWNSVLRIQLQRLGHCGGVSSIPSMAQWVKGYGVVSAAAWVAAVAQIQSLTQKLPQATGAQRKK